jgi:hypothetical protein
VIQFGGYLRIVKANIWAITDAGLDRFRDVPVATFSRKQGIAGFPSHPVLATRDGSVWFGTDNGVERWKNGEFTLYRKPGSPPLSLPVPSVREVAVPGLLSEGILAMYEDDRDRIWIGTNGGVAYFDGRRFVPLTGVPAGFCIASPKQAPGISGSTTRIKAFFMSSQIGSLNRFRGQNWVYQAPVPLYPIGRGRTVAWIESSGRSGFSRTIRFASPTEPATV